MQARHAIALLVGGVLLAACAPLAPAAAPAEPAAAPVEPAAAATSPSVPREEIVLAVLPTSNPEAVSVESKELERFLKRRLEAQAGCADCRDVQIVVPTLYGGVIEALRFGHADAAFLSAWPALLATQATGAEVALAEVREVVIGLEKTERPFYYSYWVVPPDSPIKSLQDLKGKRVAFPSPLSTSGYVMPMARLVELGLLQSQPGKEVDPRAYFEQVLFAGGYAQAWESLKQGQVDVTVIAGDVPETLYREVLAGTRVVDQQGPIPSHAVVISKDLQEPLRSQLKAALLELGRPENRPMMRKFISAIFVGFEPTTAEAHLGSLGASLRATGLQFTERIAVPKS